jgi:hypothetical protein
MPPKRKARQLASSSGASTPPTPASGPCSGTCAQRWRVRAKGAEAAALRPPPRARDPPLLPLLQAGVWTGRRGRDVVLITTLPSPACACPNWSGSRRRRRPRRLPDPHQPGRRGQCPRHAFPSSFEETLDLHARLKGRREWPSCSSRAGRGPRSTRSVWSSPARCAAKAALAHNMLPHWPPLLVHVAEDPGRSTTPSPSPTPAMPPARAWRSTPASL